MEKCEFRHTNRYDLDPNKKKCCMIDYHICNHVGPIDMCSVYSSFNNMEEQMANRGESLFENRNSHTLSDIIININIGGKN